MIREINEPGVASPMQIRGFTGGHFGDVGFYFDGIPLNDSGHADNYSDVTILIPLEIESIEIIKGPTSVLYGRGNGAGTAAFQGIKRGDFTRLLARLGLNNTYELQGVIAKDDGKLHHVYAFQGYTTDTWRDNTSWKRLNLSTRWTYDVSDNFEISLNLRAAMAKWDTALMAHSWEDPKKGSDDGSGKGNMSGGHRDRFDARLFLNYFINEKSQVSYYFFATSLENNMAELYAPSNPNPAPGDYCDGTNDDCYDQTGKREAYGTGVSYNYKGAVLGNHDFSLTFGADYLWERFKKNVYTLAWGTGDHHINQIVESDYTLKTISFFGEVNYQIIDNLRMRVGGRYDRLWGEMDYGPRNDGLQGHFTSKKIGIFSPKVGLLFTPIERLDIYANYGQGFNVPGLADSGQFFTEHQLKMTKREQYELGFRSSPYSWLDFGAVYFLANTKNDIQQDLVTRRIENAGQTRRRGLETYVKFYPVKNLTISADYSYLDVKYKKNVNNPLLEGRRYIQVPRHIINAEIAYIPPEGWGGRATLNYNIDYLLRDNPAEAIRHYKGHDFGTVDAQVNYRFNEKYKISLDVLNVFNDRPKQGIPDQGYFNYWPANPTTAYLTLEMNF
jgi:iron complex outermembrane receptor protein